MTFNRYAKKVDSTQKMIVDALKEAGVSVWVIGHPADLLCWYRGEWTVLECKPESYKRPRKDQEEQTEFLRLTNTPIVKTIHDAFWAVGL
jgi:hypothetical protein